MTFIAPDWSEIRVEVPLSRRTRNYVGTTFGGSLYAACDPHFMFLLMHQLGAGYLVWDKSAAIRFRKPGRSALRAVFRLPAGEVEEVRRLVGDSGKVDRTYTVDLVDEAGTPHASLEKTLNIRRRGASPTAGTA